MKIPFLNLLDANIPYMQEIEEAVMRVLRSGRYVGGEETERFEQMLAKTTGTEYAVGVSNGLDALRLIFKAYIELGQLRPGDEVIVPANTYIASILAVMDAGLTPVFAEPHPATMNLDTTRLGEYLTERTRAILAVHLYGRPCYDQTMADFARRHDLLIVEDNAQAIGAKAPISGINGSSNTGALGHAAAFSFYPTKNIGAMGDAGAVTTDDCEVAAAVRALANYGSDRRYHNIYIGGNCRLDPIQAAILSVKLPHLAEESARRQKIARIYRDNISVPQVILPDNPTEGSHVWHQFVIRTVHRDHLRQLLAEEGIGTDIHYAVPPHRQPALSKYVALHLPITDSIADTAISLPIGSSLTDTEAAHVASIINRKLLTIVN